MKKCEKTTLAVYDFSDRHFSKYLQMSGGRFLVSLREVNTSQRILALSSILKEDIDFWNEDVYSFDSSDSIIQEIEEKVEPLSSELYESELNDDTKEVAIVVAEYIARSLGQRS